MLVVQSFHPGDADQALRFARRTEELGGAKGHELLLMPDTTCATVIVEQIEQSYRESFDNVEVLPFVDHFKGWPKSPNSIFAEAARHIMRTRPQPWLFCEPDCVAWRTGWLEELWAEYQVALAAGKWFVADFVSVHTPELDVEDHASGNGIYPADMFEHAGSALNANSSGVAWDMAAKDQILPKLHTSELILHSWRHGSFSDWEQVEREILAFKPKIALFHSDKTGSLYPILRKGREVAKPTGAIEAAPASSEEVISFRPPPEFAGSNPAPCDLLRGNPTTYNDPHGVLVDDPAKVWSDLNGREIICDILIKSYPPDYELLRYCLRSIRKFASGFRRIVLVLPDDGQVYPEQDEWDSIIPLRIIQMVENGEGYLVQQTVKASAHEWTDADYILHLDSDCILTRPITPETFMRNNGKPIWLMTPWSHTDTPWQPITEKFLGEPVEFEFMRRFPFLIPRKLHLAISAFALAHHGQRLTDYILSQPHRSFSEFNALGALAYSRARDDFYWLDTTKEELPESVLIQRFSHDPLTDATREEYETILSGGEKDREAGLTAPMGAKTAKRNEEAVVCMSDQPPSQAITPWADRAESEKEIKRLCRALKAFQTAPVYTNRVRLELKIFEVIPGGSKIKGMKKRRSRLG